MVKVSESPVHMIPFSSRIGVTSIVPVIGISPSLTAVNSGILSFPLSTNPMSVLSLVHS